MRSPSRRGFITGTAGLATGAGLRLAMPAAAAPSTGMASEAAQQEPFWGKHQGGITTPPQTHTYFAAFDLLTGRRADVVDLLRCWTSAAARMASGQPAQPEEAGFSPVAGADTAVAGSRDDADYDAPDAEGLAADTGEVLGLPAARLTVTFGFGASFFFKDGIDRYGIASRRPDALVDLPRFVGDQLLDAHTGGDLSVQACADDPQVAFHAVRQLARLADRVAQIRWVQSGFVQSGPREETPRNLMGFKDGTNNASIGDRAAMDRFVWVGEEGPAWMRGGSYVVGRRIRIALEHWDRMKLAFQEQTIGRHKVSGAPLGKVSELDALDLDATDQAGNPIIPEGAHVRLAAPAGNDGAQMLRRSYSYNDGVNMTAERWPPWRQGLQYDAGLFFVAYQRDPRTAFIKVFERMAKFDMMNQFVTHVGGGLFACPPGPAPNECIGQSLFEAA